MYTFFSWLFVLEMDLIRTLFHQGSMASQKMVQWKLSQHGSSLSVSWFAPNIRCERTRADRLTELCGKFCLCVLKMSFRSKKYGSVIFDTI